MTTERAQKRTGKPVRLSCGCTRYYTIYPHIEEKLWCPAHESYEMVGNPDANRGRVYEQDFWSEPTPRRQGYRGGCTYKDEDGECDYRPTTRFDNWHLLRDHMHKHYMTEHTNFGATLNIKDVNRNDANGAEPPF